MKMQNKQITILNNIGVTDDVYIVIEDNIFVLKDSKDVPIASSNRVRPLSNYAFGNGANSVRHEYDLGKER